MNRFSLTVLITLLVMVGVCGCQRTTTIILVRHAEPLSGGGDPGLNASGQQRADALREVARRSRISAIYTRDQRRTQETAAPLATALGITPRVFAVGNDVQQHANAIATDIKSTRVGRTVLVVGHSNTVPAIMSGCR